MFRHCQVLIAVFLLIVLPVALYAGFTEVANSGLPGNAGYGSVVWGDYDKDGFLDLAIGNWPSGKVYHNNKNGTFSDIGITLAGGYPVWIDHDKDGDLDLISNKLYRNDNGVLFNTNVSLSYDNAALSCGDYDNDGDLDLLAMVTKSGAGIFPKLLRNDAGVFVDANIGLPKVSYPAYGWGDYDNDGDLDFAFSGVPEGASPISRIYQNDNGSFQYTSAGLAPAQGGAFSWGDYDNDGNLDLAMQGNTGTVSVAKVYRNTGSGAFTDLEALFIGVYSGAIAWADYDNDGHLDLISSGYDGTNRITKIYHQDKDAFTTTDIALFGLSSTSIAWGDYDNDGDLDLIMTGYNNGSATKIYRNDCTLANTRPSPPTNLRASLSSGMVTFTWDAGSDAETASSGLTYNVRVGTTPGSDNIVSSMANPQSGYLYLPMLGNAQKRCFYHINNLPSGRYYWSVQSIDTASAGSHWAEEQVLLTGQSYISGHVRTSEGVAVSGALLQTDTRDFEATTDEMGYYELLVTPGWTGTVTPFKPCHTFNPANRVYITGITDATLNQDFSVTMPFVDSGTSIDSENGNIAWGDYDQDGDSDLSIGKYIYRNDSGNFVLVSTMSEDFGILYYTDVDTEWNDYDNDGDLDLSFRVTGPVTMPSGHYPEMATAYGIQRNDCGSFVITRMEGFEGTATNWGDYDNDGHLDLVGWNVLLHNDGDGTFSSAGPVAWGESFDWGDYDNDGDLDLAAKDQLFKNNGNATFTDVESLVMGELPAWGDLDNDGDLDLALIQNASSNPACFIYRNDNGTFRDPGTGLVGREPAWCDFDNDGRLDLAVGSNLYWNNGNGGFVNIDGRLTGSNPTWVDVDVDRRTDLALVTNVGGTYKMRIYRNVNASPNNLPNAGSGLTATYTGGDVTFRWSAGSDTETPTGGLSYNLRIGTSPGANDILSGMSTASGGRLIRDLGNAEKNLFWRLNRVPSGPIFWSVQAIDTSFAGSAWAEESIIGATDIADVRGASDNDVVGIGPLVVTRVFDDSFYAEKPDRSAAMRVDKQNHNIITGQKIDLLGSPRTDLTTGERYFLASDIAQIGVGTIYPVGLHNLSLAGSNCGHQDGIGSGLCNIGLLVTVWGRVTQIDDSGAYFYVDDGSGIKDGTLTDDEENTGIKIARNGTSHTPGQFLTITGISSCFIGDDGKLKRLIR